MRLLCISIFVFSNFCRIYAQDHEIVNSILEEGKYLYRLEAAAWNGTDLFLEKYPEKKADIGGYLTYMQGDQTIFLFYSKDEQPSTVGVIFFDSTFSATTATLSIEKRPLNNYETVLVKIRKNALKVINSDTLFKTYNNTNLNIIPIVYNNEKKVYVLTGPTVNGVMVIGNDYVLLFDENDNVKSARRLHRNIIPIEYGQHQKDTAEFGTMHSHLAETGDYVTATDICTLMLYGKLAGWQYHYVLSEKYVSIWHFPKSSLVVLTREAFNKIYGIDKKN